MSLLGDMYCSTVNLFALFRLFIYSFLFPSQHSPPPPTFSLLCSAVMPVSKVLNDCGFESLSWVCVGESLCELEMFGVKARLSCTQKNYGSVKCEFVIEMIKGSPSGIVYHTTPKSIEPFLKRVWTCQIKRESVQKDTQNFFFYTWL